ncbi:MAG: hypothetical protein FJZ05_00725 [Candidatus Nealsonbacteria bacterium]|nr:hypothetical protein [Candidatus Nealsonbacteria bacterium]
MTKKTKTILFLICLLAFTLLAPSIVMYSQGYRLNFNPSENGKMITQTGGVFLKVAPKQVDIYINDKLKKRTDFLFGSVLIENLVPGKYKVEIKKTNSQEEYYSWQKTLAIQEKQVAEAKNIVLFPKNITFSSLSTNVEQLWLSPDQKKIILKENEKDSWALKLYDLEKNIKSHLVNEEDFFVKEPQLIDLEFSNDSGSITLEISIKETIQSFSLDISQPKPSLKRKGIIPAKTANSLLQEQAGNDLYYLDNFGYLFKNKEKLAETPFSIKQETEYSLDVFNGNIFLKENSNLYKFNYDKKVFDNFFEGISILSLSPDGKKLLYASNNEMWVVFLEDKTDQPQKKSGDKVFLIRLSDQITNISWINDNYLAFLADNIIKIIEIDDRDKINIIDVFETKNLLEEGNVNKMFWNRFDNKIYLFNEKGYLYSSNILLP